MNSLIKCLQSDDVHRFEESNYLLIDIDDSTLIDLPSIFYCNPNLAAYAAFYGAVDCFIFILKHGINIQNVDDESRSAIHFACAGGNCKMVRMIIEDFEQLNDIDRLGRTALHYSAEYNQTKISQILIETYLAKQMFSIENFTLAASALINKKDIFGITPFHLSIEKENEELVGYFIENGANVNLSDVDGCSSIHFAAKVGSISILSILIEKGAKVRRKTKSGRTIFHFAAFSKRPYIFNDLLMLCRSQNDMNINTPDQYGRIPLHYACEQGIVSVVHELLKLHSDVSRRDIDMMMPIHYAALNGNPSVMQLLINYGSPVYVKDENLRTPLHLACESGSYNAVRFLCNKYKNLINEDAKYGSTPLHFVAENSNSDNEQLVQFLVSKGVDINKKNKFGQTPLHCATQNGFCKTVSTFIESGANLNITDNSLCNPLDIAINLNEDELKDMLIENGALISPKKSSLSSRMSSASQSPCSSPKIPRRFAGLSQIDLRLDPLI